LRVITTEVQPPQPVDSGAYHKYLHAAISQAERRRPAPERVLLRQDQG
jgi:hypothetical protein